MYLPLPTVLCSHTVKSFNLTVRLDVTQVIFHGQDLIYVLYLYQGIDGLHQIVSRPVTAVESIPGSTVYPLLPGAGNGDHMLLILRAERFRDSFLVLVAQFDICVIFAMALHLRLHEKIICNQLLESTVFNAGTSEKMSESTEKYRT